MNKEDLEDILADGLAFYLEQKDAGESLATAKFRVFLLVNNLVDKHILRGIELPDYHNKNWRASLVRGAWPDLYSSPDKQLDILLAQVLGQTPLGESVNDIRDSKIASESRHALHHRDLVAGLQRAMQTLSPKERMILDYYYGLSGKETLTLREIGAAFRVSANRIQQQLRNALHKLRHPARANQILDFITDV